MAAENPTSTATTTASPKRVMRVRRDTESPQDVADATHGVQETRLAVRLELGAQVPHVDVDDVARRGVAAAPDRVEEVLAGEDLSRVAGEVLQQVELQRPELELPAAS